MKEVLIKLVQKEIFIDLDAISDSDIGDILNKDFQPPYKVKF